jgi:threonine dehydrogenase-like Zn-dependent dehydrogenase
MGMATKYLKTLKLESDVEKDTAALKKIVGFRGADCYIDFCPPAAGAGGKTPTHISVCISCLRRGGTASFMGYLPGNFELPYGPIMLFNIVIRGRFMYEREQMEQVIKMAEKGNLKLGKGAGVEVAGPYKLEQIKEAMEMAAKLPGWGRRVAIAP